MKTFLWALLLTLLSAPIGFTQSVTPTAANQVNVTDGVGGWTLQPYGGGTTSTTSFVTATITPVPTRYNDQVSGQNGLPNNGRFTSGDTFVYTQTFSGNLLVSVNDGGGGANVSSGRNVFMQNVSSDLLNQTTQNLFTDYGTSTQQNTNGWTDGATWKSGGLWARGSNVFFSVYREVDSGNFPGQSASLLMSQDGGLTWCNSSHVVSQACSGNASVSGSTADAPISPLAMWPTGIRSVDEINYCQAQSVSCPNVDSNSTYAYMFGWASDFTGFYLLRIPVGQVADLNVSEYQYSTGPNTWSSSFGSAIKYIPLPALTGNMGRVWYDSTLGQYVFVGMVEGSPYASFVVASAAHPWGPWTKTSIIPSGDLDAGFPNVIYSRKTVLPNGCVQYPMATGGSFAYQTSVPLTNNYSTLIQTITLCNSSAISPRTSPAANAPQWVAATGEYQEFQFAAPDGSATEFDSSGQGHNGTGYSGGGTSTSVSGIYTTKGNASFDGVSGTFDYHIDTGLNYTGTNFTEIIVFRKQNSVGGTRESLLWNSTPLASQGDFVIQRNGTTRDAWQIGIDGGATSPDLVLTDNSWNEIMVTRSGTTATVYDASSFNGSTVTPVQTFTAGSHALTGEIFLGGFGTSASQQYFGGEIAYHAFYSSALTTAQLQTAQQALNAAMAAKGVYLAQTVAGNQALLDTQGPLVAYSLRKLRSAYTGRAVNITRASDSASTDIGFTSTGDFDTTTTGTFCSGTTCTVNTWYDQSGRGFDAICTASPVIYTGGAVVTSGSTGRAAISFNGTTQYCNTPPSFFYFGIYGTAEGVGNLATGTANSSEFQGWWAAGGTSFNVPTGADAILQQTSGGNIFYDRNNIGSASLATTLGTPSVMSTMFGDFYMRQSVDGNSSAPQNATNPPWRFYLNFIGIGRDAATTNFWTGKISEEIMFPYAISAEEYTNLRANQKPYYGTP